MTTLTQRPMQLLLVEFNELYARHLCRHSQAGINVLHLIALFVIWYAIYGLLFWIIGIEWVLAIPLFVYLAAVVPNVPIRVFAATVLFLAGILVAAVWLPVSWWSYIILIPVAYKLQAWSHKLYSVESDMREFNKKYEKGSTLFVVLLIYEVPIVLNYFFRIAACGLALAARHENTKPQAARLAEENQERAAAKAS